MSCYLAAINWLVDERDKLHHVQVFTLRDGKCGGLLLVRLRQMPAPSAWARHSALAMRPQGADALWPARQSTSAPQPPLQSMAAEAGSAAARPAEADLNLDSAVRLVDEHTRRDGCGCYSRKKGQQLREEQYIVPCRG